MLHDGTYIIIWFITVCISASHSVTAVHTSHNLYVSYMCEKDETARQENMQEELW
jgi:hypothetical protein